MLGGRAKKINKTTKISTKSRQRPKGLKIDSSQIKYKVLVLQIQSLFSLIWSSPMTLSKRKLLHRYQVAASLSKKLINITWHYSSQTAAQEGTKNGADYSALIQKARWFEAR